eukprot:Hpha_TRINITY_DN7877_c0_g1::TRINITY_DN7877_c0_g1_i1::g.185601::m.185601
MAWQGAISRYPPPPTISFVCSYVTHFYIFPTPNEQWSTLPLFHPGNPPPLPPLPKDVCCLLFLVLFHVLTIRGAMVRGYDSNQGGTVVIPQSVSLHINHEG